MILRQKAGKQDSKHSVLGDCLGFRSSYHEMDKDVVHGGISLSW